MKKLMLILAMVLALFCNTMALAVENDVYSDDNFDVSTLSGESDRPRIETDESKSETEKNENITEASEKILENMSRKERKIAKYTDKYNNTTLAHTAYWLDFAQLYSIPICIILITWGAFNCYIIGEKKLDKREHGFAMIVAALIGLVVFQVLPFLFALLVVGK